jgi:protein-disulfide isomerase
MSDSSQPNAHTPPEPSEDAVLEGAAAANPALGQPIPKPNAPRFHPFAAGILGAFIGLIAGIGIGMQSAPKPAAMRKPMTLTVQVNGQTAQLTGTPVDGNPLDGARHIIGQANAKITMVEFGDYRCGYCRLYALEIFPQLKSEFVDSGKVRYAYRDTMSVGGAQTIAVSNATACVAEQDKFWAFHDLMFAQQDRWAGIQPGNDLNRTLASLSQQVGADPARVQSCVDAGRNAKAVQDDIAAASAFGVSGTPSFIINGYLFSGALPLEAWRQVFKEFGVV